MVESGAIYRVTRGIYALPDAWEDELFFAVPFCKGDFFPRNRLVLHGMTDRTPIRYTMTFPFGYTLAELKSKVYLQSYPLKKRTITKLSKKLTYIYNIIINVG